MSFRKKEHVTVGPARARPVVSAAPRASLPTAAALRAVLAVAAATSLVACDPGSPKQWPDSAARAVRRVGSWLGVVDDPAPLAGAIPVVHPAPPPAPSASSSASSK